MSELLVLAGGAAITVLAHYLEIFVIPTKSGSPSKAPSAPVVAPASPVVSGLSEVLQLALHALLKTKAGGFIMDDHVRSTLAVLKPLIDELVAGPGAPAGEVKK